MSDRRAWDPFAPARRADPTPVVAAATTVDDAVATPDAMSRVSVSANDGLDDMRRVDLVALAESEGIPAYGSKADLIERIRRYRVDRG